MTPEAGRRYLDKARQSLAHARAILSIEFGEDAVETAGRFIHTVAELLL